MSKKIILLVWIIFIISHLINLTSLPLFEDEALYLLLSDQISKSPFQNFFIYPINGLLPMFGWMISVTNLFFHDSFIAGRFLNVLLASTLIFWIVKISNLYNLNNTFQVMAFILLIISPIIHLNSRVALLDTSILVFTAWYIYFTAIYLKTTKNIYLLGLLLSLLPTFLTKATAFFGLFPVLLLIFINFKKDYKFKLSYLKLFFTYFIVGIILILIFYKFGDQIFKDSGSSLIFHEQFSQILSKIKLNLFLTFIWVKVYYLSFVPVPILFIIFWNKIKKWEIYSLLAVWIFSSIIFMIILNRFYYPRHILILSLPIIIISCVMLSEIPKKVAIIFFLFICLIRIVLGLDIITKISHTDLALEDRFEYFENYTSGVNIKPITNTLEELSKGKQIIVWLDGSYVLEYGLRRESNNNTNIQFKSFKLNKSFTQKESQIVGKDPHNETYVIVNRWSPQNIKELKLIKTFDNSFRHGQQFYIIP